MDSEVLFFISYFTFYVCAIPSDLVSLSLSMEFCFYFSALCVYVRVYILIKSLQFPVDVYLCSSSLSLQIFDTSPLPLLLSVCDREKEQGEKGMRA